MDWTFTDSLSRKFNNFVPIESSRPISLHTEITLDLRFSSLVSSVIPFPRFFLISPISLAISIRDCNNLIISRVIPSILLRNWSMLGML